MTRSVRLSLLDRSRTRSGEPDETALRHIERTERAEELGYHRFWVAEHHAVPGIASGSPPVLVAAVAGRTSRIRVGSGGVMLPAPAPTSCSPRPRRSTGPRCTGPTHTWPGYWAESTGRG